MIQEARLERRNISEIKPWEKNPRDIDKKEFERLKRSIQKHGIYKPLLVNQDKVVLGGNMRLKAFIDLGVESVMCSIGETKTEAEMVGYALSDNDRFGYYQDQELAELIASVPDLELPEYKVDLGKPIDLAQLMQQFGPEPIEDEAPEVSDEEPISKLGEIYQLGRHRLMCGDSTKIEDVERLMDGKKADMVFTDPPYNMAYEGTAGNKRSGILNDKMSANNFYNFLYDAFVNILTFSNGSHYICMSSAEIDTLKVAYEQSGGHFQYFIIWVKNKFTLSGADYQHQYEVILYGWKDGGSHYFINDRGQGVVWNEIDKKAKFIDGKTEISVGTTKIIIDGKVTGQIVRGKRKTDIWEYNKPTKSEDHPTMKPIKLIDEAIRNSSLPGQIVMDLFLGSGSTLIASEQSDRICYGMELDPKYCDVIRKRYAKFIGKEDEWETITPLVK